MPLKDSENENVVTFLQLKYICVYSVIGMCVPVRKLKYNVMNVHCGSTVLATLVFFFHSYSCSVVKHTNSIMVYNIFDKHAFLSLTFIFLQYTLFATIFLM